MKHADQRKHVMDNVSIFSCMKNEIRGEISRNENHTNYIRYSMPPVLRGTYFNQKVLVTLVILDILYKELTIKKRKDRTTFRCHLGTIIK